jgi:exonuclease III
MNYYYYYFLSATIRCQLNCHSYTIIPEEKPFLWNGVSCLERHLSFKVAKQFRDERESERLNDSMGQKIEMRSDSFSFISFYFLLYYWF